MLIDRFHKERFLFLLISLLVYLALAPFFASIPKMRLFLAVSLTVVLMFSVYALSDRPRDRLHGTIIALPMFLFSWVGSWTTSLSVSILADLSAVVFFVFTIVMILRFIYRCSYVSGDVIAAAVVVYLLMGVVWGFLYQGVELIWPGSFSFPEAMSRADTGHFFYYSFVTLTTLGYGDITPLDTRAGTLAVLEAIIGQIYMTVLIARLVGIHIAQKSQRGNEEDR